MGVVSSPVTGGLATGMPLAKRAVAGAGIGILPCSQVTMPLPRGTDRLLIVSTPRRSSARAHPMRSVMLSSAPTSWK